MSHVYRRTLLTGGLAATASAAVGWAIPVPAAAAPAGLPRPRLVASFGPNGTHYPPYAPWLGARAATEIEVPADWAAIANAVRSLTPNQCAAGVAIRVHPGVLAGGGSGSTSPAVLARVGDASWARNVLICPRDGFGTVTIASDGIRLDRCAALSLFGFVSSGSLTMTYCSNLDVGWSRFSGASITRGGADLSCYELVLGFRYSAQDTMGIRPTGATQMTDISRFGCVFGPSVKRAGDGAHCDTIQLEGTGSGPFGPFNSIDCVDYGSSNAALLLHDGVTRAEFHHCLVLAGDLPWQMFPLRPGDYRGHPNAFAGGCRDVRAYNSVIAGPVGRMGFTHVHNTMVSYQLQASQAPRVSGAWMVNTDATGWSRSDLMTLQSLTDYSIPSLSSVWRW